MNKRERDRIARAAHRGAAWLDKRVPGWSRKVRRRKLDLGSTCDCVLGQIEGGYHDAYFDGLTRLGLDDEAGAARLGFRPPDVLEDREDAWDILTEAWRDELSVRPR